MVFEIIQDTLRMTNLTSESEEYLAKRQELRLAEIEMMRQIERVAAMRRGLPKGAVMEDYLGPRAGAIGVRHSTTRLRCSGNMPW